MSRGVDPAKGVFYATSRGAERILPPIALWFLMWPLTEVLGARHAWQSHDRVPAARLPVPPGSKRPSTYQRWRHFSRSQTHWWLLDWLDRLAEAKWQRRFDVTGLDRLVTALAERPVIVATVHTTSLVVLPAWLRSVGVPAAAVPMDATWFTSPARKRKVALAERSGVAFALRPTPPRDMVEFLTPGHAIVLTSDFVGGRTTRVQWGTRSMTVSTGIFRRARLTGAAVVPAIMFNTGRWRYETTIFDAVPQELVAAADSAAAARYLVECLLPPSVAPPDQATDVLVETIS